MYIERYETHLENVQLNIDKSEVAYLRPDREVSDAVKRTQQIHAIKSTGVSGVINLEVGVVSVTM